MNHVVSDIAFTQSVKAFQEKMGSRQSYASMEQGNGWRSTVDERLASFIAERDSFYFGTASATGRPYIQHRGGHKGFLKVLDETTLAFADYSGNRQYISTGNLSENDQAHLFLMDYPNQRRVKIWGRARVVDDDPTLLASLLSPDYKANPERAIVFEIEAWDTNCPQHILPRFTEEEAGSVNKALRARVAELEAELAAIRA